MKLRMNKTVGAVAAAGLAMVAVGATMNPAFADPIGAPTQRAIATVGSDTTYNVLNGLSETIKIGNVKQIASYDPSVVNPGLISPKAAANCQNLTRPNGSSAGRAALLNALTPANAINGCYDSARSSSLNLAPVATATGGLTYVPFARDAFTYAVLKDSLVPRDLTLADLQAIYQCDPAFTAAPPTGLGIKPLMPQSSSGTTQYWLAQMGITAAAVNTTCVKDNRGGPAFQEHDGRVLLSNLEIVPMSIANAVAQASGVQADLRGSSDLGNLAGVGATVSNDQSSLIRDVYNIIPTNKIATAPWSTIFVGGSSLVCQDTATIKKYGFGVAPNCGSTTNQTPLS